MTSVITAIGFTLLLRDEIVIPGARRWIVANLILAVALIATSIAGIDSTPSLTMTITGLLVFVSLIHQSEAILIFSELRYRRWVVRAVEAAGIVAIACAFAFHVPIVAFVATISTACAVPSIVLVWRMLVRRNRPLRFSDWFVAFAYATFCVVLVLAVVTLPPADAAGRLLDGAGPSAFYGLGFVAIICLQAGYIVMTKEESDFRLMRLATTDPLTGIWNRRTFMEAADAEYARCRRKAVPLALVMFDLDHFKKVNDAHGHAVGDLVLKRFVSHARSALREYDRLGRYGGEEFVLLLPETPLDDALEIASRICAECRAATMDLRGTPVTVTVSAGVAMANDGDTLGELLARADAALYRAKDEGRDRVIADGA